MNIAPCRTAAVLLALVFGSSLAEAQLPATGLQNPWDARKTVAEVQKDTTELRPMLAQLRPQAWVDTKGAPTTFILQWQSAQQQLNDVINVAARFAQKTESLSEGLDLYFRLEALESTERSLAEGVQHYDTRAAADQLNRMISRNFTSREHLREYLRELALSTEQNFKIADQEAQSCRAALSRQGTPTAGKRRTN